VHAKSFHIAADHFHGAHSAGFNLLHELLKAAGEAGANTPKPKPRRIGHVAYVGGSGRRGINDAIVCVSLRVLKVNDCLSGEGWFAASTCNRVLGFVGLIKDDNAIATKPALDLV